MPNYENETCEGCLHMPITPDERYCVASSPRDAVKHGWCENFTPSLECRKVRALEHLGDCVRWSSDGTGALIIVSS